MTIAQDSHPVPNHVAIIMDGNGRWAKARGLARTEGHRAGTESARAIVEACLKRDIRHLTLYTFSRENWKRPETEVRFLFDLLVDFIGRELPSLEERGIRLHTFGEVGELPFATRKALEYACRKTAANERMHLNLALNYSGREEILRACRRLLEAATPAQALTEERFVENLYTAGQPDPDLVIRTSGEVRVSNFLLFQTAYSEFYFSDILWPDFTSEHLDEALQSYARRSRRFGTIDAAAPCTPTS